MTVSRTLVSPRPAAANALCVNGWLSVATTPCARLTRVAHSGECTRLRKIAQDCARLAVHS
eukprot:2010700-Pleurochrysis_carterae.AAC.2